MSDIPATVDQLAILEGRWTGGGEVFANPFGPAGRSEGAWDFRMDGPRIHLIHDYSETRSDGHLFEGHGVLALDPTTAEFVWFWFDTYGHPPLSPARGRWRKRRLELRKSTPRGVGSTAFDLDGDTLSYSVDTMLAGTTEFIPITRAVFHRDRNAAR